MSRLLWFSCLSFCTTHLVLCQTAPELIAAGTSKGGRPSFTIQSVILKETRRVHIAFPASFPQTQLPRRYPVTIVLDGEYLLEPVQTASRQLVRHGQIPESVLVAIDNTDRLRDLTPPGLSVSGSSLQEGGDRFLDFIERELLPALERQFRTAVAPRIFIGHSSGGILATYAAATRNTFRVVIALDTPVHLGDNWLAEKLIARAGVPQTGQPPLSYASYNAVYGWSPALWKRLATAAASAGWIVQHDKLPHETHNSMTMTGSYLGLRELFARYSKLAAPTFPTTSTLPYYEKAVPAFYGAALEPPQALMREIVEDLLIEGRAALAREVFERLTVSYGLPADAAEIQKQIAEAALMPPPAETVESLLAKPFPTPAEARDILGEWSGETWMHEDERNEFTLRIRAVDGRVSGELINTPEPGTELKMSLEYLKLGADEFSFGFRNGMRPRGMLIHETRRKGEYFEGKMVFGGISAKRPDGSERPTIHVRLKKIK